MNRWVWAPFLGIGAVLVGYGYIAGKAESQRWVAYAARAGVTYSQMRATAERIKALPAVTASQANDAVEVIACSGAVPMALFDKAAEATAMLMARRGLSARDAAQQTLQMSGVGAEATSIALNGCDV